MVMDNYHKKIPSTIKNAIVCQPTPLPAILIISSSFLFLFPWVFRCVVGVCVLYVIYLCKFEQKKAPVSESYAGVVSQIVTTGRLLRHTGPLGTICRSYLSLGYYILYINL